MRARRGEGGGVRGWEGIGAEEAASDDENGFERCVWAKRRVETFRVHVSLCTHGRHVKETKHRHTAGPEKRVRGLHGM